MAKSFKMNDTYSLFLNNKEFLIPRDFDLLIKFPKSVSSQLVSKLSYNVESNVSYEIFQKFIDYIQDNSKVPVINSENLYEYRLLSDEFNFLSELTTKPEFKAIYQISLLKKSFSNGSKDHSKSEKIISEELDFFIENYPEDLRQIPIPSLYNIFYSKERKLTNHEAAYKFITDNKQFEQTLSILIGSLDGSKLSRESLKKLISNREQYFGFMPMIDGTFFDNEKVTECNQKHEHEMKQLKEHYDQIISQYENEILQLKDQVQKLNQTVDEMNECDIIECPFQNNELSGIFSYIEKNKICEVKISGGGKTSDIHPITGIIKYDESHINDYYFNYYNITTTESNNWIEFDFGLNKIKLNSYTLRTNDYGYHPKSWLMKGSNDRVKWDTIDEKINKTELFGAYKQFHFDCKNESQYYHFIRFIQNDSWTSNKPYNIYLTCIEFFGSIMITSNKH